MERITSFSVDHTQLNKGIYVSRQDGGYTTFDIRMCTPNQDQPLKPEAAHTIEHIGATLLRNGIHKDQVLYFGPMGCMTGFYLIMKDTSLKEATDIVLETFLKIKNWTDSIPGASAEECGNYTYMDLDSAKSSVDFFLSSPLEHTYHYL